MGQPHKHAELIKAWADGAEIEFRISSTEWESIKEPKWINDYEYRIKPEPKVIYVNYYNDKIGGFAHPSRAAADTQVAPSRTARIRVTYTEGQFDE